MDAEKIGINFKVYFWLFLVALFITYGIYRVSQIERRPQTYMAFWPPDLVPEPLHPDAPKPPTPDPNDPRDPPPPRDPSNPTNPEWV